MKNELSALLDDELEAERHAAMLCALCDDIELRDRWDRYHLIGDTLRRSAALDVNLTDRVMTALQAEPTVLAPGQTASRRTPPPARRVAWWRGATAMAASLAGVTAVAWLALSMPAHGPQPAQARQAAASPEPLSVHTGTPALSVAAAAPVAPPEQSNRLRSYLVAHQAYAAASRFDGGAGYVRTVAANR